MEPTHAILDDAGVFQYFGFYDGDPTTLPTDWTAVPVTIADPVGDEPSALHGIVWDTVREDISTNWVELDRLMKAKIIAEAESASSNYVSTAASKPLIYARKAAEVDLWSALDSSAKAALTTEEKQSLYPFLYYDAEAFGDTMDDAYVRFQVGRQASLASLAQIEAQVQKAYSDMTNVNDTVDRIAAVDGAVASLGDLTDGYLTDENDDILTDENDNPLTV